MKIEYLYVPCTQGICKEFRVFFEIIMDLTNKLKILSLRFVGNFHCFNAHKVVHE